MTVIALPVFAAIGVLVIATILAPALTSPARLPRPSAPGRRHRRRGRPWPTRRASPVGDELAVAAWCDRVASGVRAGSSLRQSVVDAELVAPSPFEPVVHAIARGHPLGAAFLDGRHDAATPAGLVAPVVAACAELGGPTASALERVSTVLVARATERDERRTASAQATLSARVLTVLPLAVVGLLVLTEPSIRAVVTTPAGVTCLALGGFLDLVGWRWMRRLIGASS